MTTPPLVALALCYLATALLVALAFRALVNTRGAVGLTDIVRSVCIHKMDPVTALTTTPHSGFLGGLFCFAQLCI
jgi:hypothetical protein